MGTMWRDVSELFDELAEQSQENYAVAIATHYECRETRRRRYEAECKTDPVKAARRSASQSRHVKRKEALDPQFKAKRRERSREYARELSEAREAEKVERFYDRGGVLPGLESVVPVRKATRLLGKVDEVREKQRDRMRKTRAEGKRCDSMPLLERCA